MRVSSILVDGYKSMGCIVRLERNTIAYLMILLCVFIMKFCFILYFCLNELNLSPTLSQKINDYDVLLLNVVCSLELPSI